jgi:Fe-S-cluster-containing dehydrogenase component/CRP-like cAMP-binding protein
MLRATSISVEKPHRWDEPFDANMSMTDVDTVLAIEPFKSIDPVLFPRHLALQDILLNDARIRHYQPGDIIVRRNDYGNSAFFILSGSILVDIGGPEERMPDTLLGRKEARRHSLWTILNQWWRSSAWPEVRRALAHPSAGRRSGAAGAPARGNGTTSAVSSGALTHLHDVSIAINRYPTVRRLVGTFFGEIAALGRTARTATVFTDAATTLLEIRWQGLREIRKYAPALRQLIDERYRQSSLETHLIETAIFQHLDGTALEQVKEHTQFETYGHFDWQDSYKQLAGKQALERLDDEPVIVREGDYANGIILIRGGFARVSRRFASGHLTRSYLGRGQLHGFQEIVHNWRSGTTLPLQTTLRAIGYVDVLFVPTAIIEQYVLPSLPERLLPPALDTMDMQHQDAAGPQQIESHTGISAAMLEQLVDHRFINGTATMLIDLDRCTRCDDCVRACAATHRNNPRFLRAGTQLDHYLVANACMHCIDPVCLIGCPTGAISRNTAGGEVVINDKTCIGCATCANNCPYQAIRMVDIRDPDGNPVLDEQSYEPIRKATKCDLCVEQPGGPACQDACPHSALVRIDLSSPGALAAWLKH